MTVTLSTRNAEACTVVEVGGEIDQDSSTRIREHVDELIGGARYRLIFDLEHLDRFDSAGVDALEYALKQAGEHDGSVRLVCDRERVLRVLRDNGNRVPVYPSVEAALAAG
ncbi:STAS domain-containing protein [Amycolatopsis anabasis]|uniref:STAS domain-containing protein n=1 Tax=Amycolatopsis anabasis TaxID=1840409 RepID=UPI00131C25B8|nr:STAS domain-containing protein [Amycolatopsis anabasis]